MIGKMIQRIRKEKGITKTKLSEMTDINIGHLTHIEKGERNPSHKALKVFVRLLIYLTKNYYILMIKN